MVTFLITVRSPEVVIRSAIIPPSKYSRHESSIRDVEIACGIRGYLSVGYTYVDSRLEVQALRDHWRDTKGNRTVNTCPRFGKANRSRTVLASEETYSYSSTLHTYAAPRPVNVVSIEVHMFHGLLLFLLSV